MAAEVRLELGWAWADLVAAAGAVVAAEVGVKVVVGERWVLSQEGKQAGWKPQRGLAAPSSMAPKSPFRRLTMRRGTPCSPGRLSFHWRAKSRFLASSQRTPRDLALDTKMPEKRVWRREGAAARSLRALSGQWRLSA